MVLPDFVQYVQNKAFLSPFNRMSNHGNFLNQSFSAFLFDSELLNQSVSLIFLFLLNFFSSISLLTRFITSRMMSITVWEIEPCPWPLKNDNIDFWLIFMKLKRSRKIQFLIQTLKRFILRNNSNKLSSTSNQ